MKQPFLLTYSIKTRDGYRDSEANAAVIRDQILSFLSADTERTTSVIKYDDVETTISGMIEVPSGLNSTKQDAIERTIKDAFSSLLEEQKIDKYSIDIHGVIYAGTLKDPVIIYM
ncbi:hypothetical protein [Providencia rettgeri]|uniref:hypothetical protein n=1 Tax=Providencia rettgeri TaxID=587 RepID=UPI0018E43532|nr:hypothetical protein [Providencia rettgeri]MBI6191822.1 hypothetical protein [Providencia rettgeri]